MRRAPVIILILLVLLSLGGVWTYQLFRKAAPTFSEVDSFLRYSAASGDWRFDTHTQPPSYRTRKTGWWTRFGIRRHSHFQQDHYRFVKTSILTAEYVFVAVWREDGKVVKLQFTGSSLPAEDFKKVIFRKFPPLGHPRYKI